MIHRSDRYCVVRFALANSFLLIGHHHWWDILAVAASPLLQLVRWWCIVAILVATLANLLVVVNLLFG